jgi:hypothetical protein
MRLYILLTPSFSVMLPVYFVLSTVVQKQTLTSTSANFDKQQKHTFDKAQSCVDVRSAYAAS